MNKSTKHLEQATLAGSLFLASLNGCSQNTDCSLNNSDPQAIEVTSASQATSLCQNNRNRVLKCIVIPDGMNDNAEEQDANCADSNYQDQINTLFSNKDVAVCKATLHPDLVNITCQQN